MKGLFILIISLMLFACNGGKKIVEPNNCLDENWAGFKDCTEEYLPVCGCDGKTYSNACGAYNAKLKSWVDGKCKE